MVNGCHGPSTPQPARHTAARKKMPAGSGRDDRAKQGLKRSAGGDLADFGVFDGAPTEFFNGGLQHGTAEVVPVDVQIGERLQQPTERLD